MKRLEFLAALSRFDAKNGVGTYLVNGEEEILYKWKNCVFYFDGEDKAICVGDVPMALSIETFSTFKRKKGITFENGDHDEWNPKNIMVDNETEASREFIASKFHRIFTFSDLKILIRFLYFIENYKEIDSPAINDENADEYERKRELERLAVDGQLEERCRQIEQIANYNVKMNFIEHAKLLVPKVIPSFRRVKETSLEVRELEEELAFFDEIVNPFQTSDKLRHYYSKNEVSVSYDVVDGRGELTMQNGIRTCYEHSKEGVQYESIMQTGELEYVRLLHSTCRYLPGLHLSGEVILIIRSISPRTAYFTERSCLYNLSEDMYFDGKTWKRPSEEEIREITKVVQDVSKKTYTDVTDKILPENSLSFTPVKPI